MLTKFLLLEAVVIVGMLGTFVHQQLPETTIRVGENEFSIKSGENSAPASPPLPRTSVPATPSATELLFPVADHDTAAIISLFGDPRGNSRSHKGIDIKAPAGTPVVAVVDGFVERIREGGSGGRQLYLRDGRGRLFYYAHLQDWAVEEFAAVEAGEVLGSVGDTGNARGTTPHLHFEILLGKARRAVDPIAYWTGV